MSLLRLPTALAGALTVVALVAASAAPAVAASSRPAVTLGTSIDGPTATISVDLNRGTQQIRSCTYVLDSATPASCGAATSQGKKASRYTISLTGQSVGKHRVLVMIVLTDRGTASNTTSFTIATARVFALAFTNVDGVAGYDPSDGDVLIAELVDTNSDNVISAGDTVISDRYPLTFAGTSFGSFTATSHTVTADSSSGSFVIVLGGAAEFYWDHEGGLDVYGELVTPSTGTDGTQLQDNDGTNFGTCDQIVVRTTSPSVPDTTVPDTGPSGCGAGQNLDQTFLDVILDLP